MRFIIFFTVIVFLCVGCQNTNQLQNTIELQQQTINDMQTRLQKLELAQAQLQQNMDSLKKEYMKAQEEIKKVQPTYVDGSIQEGD
jgi:septal ring factor EnvC (AmiA/AmiB activator)